MLVNVNVLRGTAMNLTLGMKIPVIAPVNLWNVPKDSNLMRQLANVNVLEVNLIA